MGQPFSAAYCASKGGVVNLTRALAVEYLDRGVRVNCVAPGGMRTPLTKGFRLPEGANVDLLRPVMSKVGVSEPEEVAALHRLRRVGRRALHDRLDRLHRRRPGHLRRRIPDMSAAGGGLITEWTSLWDLIEQARRRRRPTRPFGDRRERDAR